jgi:hypothetical protein
LGVLLGGNPLPEGSYQIPEPAPKFSAFVVVIDGKKYRLEFHEPETASYVRDSLKRRYPDKSVYCLPLVKQLVDGREIEFGYAEADPLKPCFRCHSGHFWWDGVQWNCSDCLPRPGYLTGVIGTQTTAVPGGKKVGRRGKIEDFPASIQTLLKSAAQAQGWDKEMKLDVANAIHEHPDFAHWAGYLKAQIEATGVAENSEVSSISTANPANPAKQATSGKADCETAKPAKPANLPADGVPISRISNISSPGSAENNPVFALQPQDAKPRSGDSAKELLDQAGYSLQVVTDPAQVADAVATLLAVQSPVGVDIETAKRPGCTHKKAGLDPYLSAIRLMQFAADKKVFVFDIGAINPEPLRPLFEKPLIAHNAIFELKHCLHAGFNPNKLHCTLLMARVRYGERLSLADVCKKVLRWDVDKSLQTSDWSGVLTQDQIEYAALDAVAVTLLYPVLKQQLQEKDQWDCYKLLGAAQRPVANLELAGCPFDLEGHKALIQDWQGAAETAATELTTVMGQINFNSGSQIAAWLEANLDPDTLKTWPRTAKGGLSTGKDNLGVTAEFGKNRTLTIRAHA